MKRTNKYPDTDYFVNVNINPKGKIVGDCVIRAIACALDETWDEVYDALYTIGRKYKYMPNDRKTYNRYLTSKGWVKCNQPRKADGTKYTGKEWCEWLNRNNSQADSIIAHIGGHHIVCIRKDSDDMYKVFDHWNSAGGCIGNFWVRGECDG